MDNQIMSKSRLLSISFVIAITANVLLLVVGQKKSEAQSPIGFLHAPYPGTAIEFSIFDHASPTYKVDEQIVAFTGDEANANCPPGQIPPPGSDGVHCWWLNNVRAYWSYTINSGLGDWLAYDGHDGIDYGMADYRVIYAAAASDQVLEAGWDNPQNHNQNFGLYVKLRHSQGYDTLYGHLSSIAVQACNPSCVSIEAGQIIGVSGNTGNSSGIHLHFGVYNSTSGEPIDPYGWTGQAGADPHASIGQPSDSLWVDPPNVIPSTEYTVLPSGTALAYPVPPNGVVVNVFDESPDGCWDTDGTYWYVSPATSGPPTCAARWNFPASAGEYEVYAFVPANHATSEGAIYTIFHQGTSSQAIINQCGWDGESACINNNWRYIGKYYFTGNGTEYVYLTNATLDGSQNQHPYPPELGAGAIQFQYVGPGEPVFEIPTATPTAVATLPSNTTIILAHMNEAAGTAIADSSGRNHSGTALRTSIVAGYSGNARQFDQAGGLKDKITFGSHAEFYQAANPSASTTIDLWFRYNGTGNNTQALANLLGNFNSNFPEPNRWGGWYLGLTPNYLGSESEQLEFTVFSGNDLGTYPATVKLPISALSNTDWVHVKAIKNGSTSKLKLCAAVNQGPWSSAEATHTEGIFYWRQPGTTLDLGVDYDTNNLAANWHGDIDEFVYKNTADSCIGTDISSPTPTITPTPLPTGTPTRTPTPTITRTPTRTSTPTACPTTLCTPTRTPTRTSTVTRTATRTATPTVPTPTRTLTPSATPLGTFSLASPQVCQWTAATGLGNLATTYCALSFDTSTYAWSTTRVVGYILRPEISCNTSPCGYHGSSGWMQSLTPPGTPVEETNLVYDWFGGGALSIYGLIYAYSDWKSPFTGNLCPQIAHDKPTSTTCARSVSVYDGSYNIVLNPATIKFACHAGNQPGRVTNCTATIQLILYTSWQ